MAMATIVPLSEHKRPARRGRRRRLGPPAEIIPFPQAKAEVTAVLSRGIERDRLILIEK